MKTIRQGFTLIELLVVISIIALLIGILLPVLGSAREAGRTAACASNIRQIMIAVHAYAGENKDYVVPEDYSAGSGTFEAFTSTVPGGWQQKLRPYLVGGGEDVAATRTPSPFFVDPSLNTSNPLEDHFHTHYGMNMGLRGSDASTATPAPFLGFLFKYRRLDSFLTWSKTAFTICGSNPFRGRILEPGHFSQAALDNTALNPMGPVTFAPHPEFKAGNNVGYIDGHAALVNSEDIPSEDNRGTRNDAWNTYFWYGETFVNPFNPTD